MAYDLHISTEPDDQTIVRDKLVAYNRTKTGRAPGSRHYTIIARPESGDPVGGIVATVRWDWLYIDLLWVDEDHRGMGVGTALMDRAEREALAAGITQAHTSTASFQARPFYEKRGYQVFGVLEDSPQGHNVFFLKKRDLAPHG